MEEARQQAHLTPSVGLLLTPFGVSNSPFWKWIISIIWLLSHYMANDSSISIISHQKHPQQAHFHWYPITILGNYTSSPLVYPHLIVGYPVNWWWHVSLVDSYPLIPPILLVVSSLMGKSPHLLMNSSSIPHRYQLFHCCHWYPHTLFKTSVGCWLLWGCTTIYSPPYLKKKHHPWPGNPGLQRPAGRRSRPNVSDAEGGSEVERTWKELVTT